VGWRAATSGGCDYRAARKPCHELRHELRNSDPSSAELRALQTPVDTGTFLQTGNFQSDGRRFEPCRRYHQEVPACRQIQPAPAVGRGAPPAEPARPAYLAVAVNGSVWLQLGRLLMCDLSVSFPLAFGPSNVPLIFSPSDSVLPK
jgi:hypothetical protein